MLYDWKAGLALFVLIVAITKVGQFLAFRVPELRRMRTLNFEQDAIKRAKPKYPPVIDASNKVGLITNFVFFAAVAPFLVTLEQQSVWRGVLDIVLILMIYDFFYYLTHRFVFHGPLLLQVHAVHHQARLPTHIDAYYVHPLETFIGIMLFLGTIIGFGLALGPLHAVSVAIATVIFTQLNIINHVKIELPYFPFRTLHWISAKHAVHHQNMQKGNYATITLLYDKLFGTLD